MKSILTLLTCSVLLAGCGAMGQFFPEFEPSSSSTTGPAMPSMTAPRPAQQSGPVRPETLVECRGHVLVPAIGMRFVPMGGRPPSRGQYLREESLTAPYRIFPPGAAGTMDYVPSRLNVDLDGDNRIVNLRCG